MRRSCSAGTGRRGISRVELIMVCFVALLVIGLVLPWVYQARGTSRRSFCQSRQMVLAKGMFLHTVESPFMVGYRDVQTVDRADFPVPTSWVFPVLPYIHPSGSAVAEEMKLQAVSELVGKENTSRYRSGPYRDEHQAYGTGGEFAGNPVTLYLPELVCPDSGRSPTATQPQPISFVVNCGQPDLTLEEWKGLNPEVENAQSEFRLGRDHLGNGVFVDGLTAPRRMTLDYLYANDGIEHTLMLSENLDAGQAFDTTEAETGFTWIDSFVDGEPILDRDRLLAINERSEGGSEPTLRTARPSSNHRGGVNVAYCDGAIQFLNEKVDYVAYCQFLTSANQEVFKPGTFELIDPPYRLLLSDDSPEQNLNQPPQPD